MKSSKDVYLLRFYFSFKFSCSDAFYFLAKLHVPLTTFYELCVFSQITVMLNYRLLLVWQQMAGKLFQGPNQKLPVMKSKHLVFTPCETFYMIICSKTLMHQGLWRTHSCEGIGRPCGKLCSSLHAVLVAQVIFQQ